MCGYTTTSRSGSTGNPWMTTDLEDGEVSVTRRALGKPQRREMQRRRAVVAGLGVRLDDGEPLAGTNDPNHLSLEGSHRHGQHDAGFPACRAHEYV